MASGPGLWGRLITCALVRKSSFLGAPSISKSSTMLYLRWRQLRRVARQRGKEGRAGGEGCGLFSMASQVCLLISLSFVNVLFSGSTHAFHGR